jgi:hypothetical protein
MTINLDSDDRVVTRCSACRPSEPTTRHVCRECGKDLRLRPFVRLLDGSIVCRRCYRDLWAPR